MSYERENIKQMSGYSSGEQPEDGGELTHNAKLTTPALDSPRPFRAILRHSGLSAIDNLDD